MIMKRYTRRKANAFWHSFLQNLTLIFKEVGPYRCCFFEVMMREKILTNFLLFNSHRRWWCLTRRKWRKTRITTVNLQIWRLQASKPNYHHYIKGLLDEILQGATSRLSWLEHMAVVPLRTKLSKRPRSVYYNKVDDACIKKFRNAIVLGRGRWINLINKTRGLGNDFI